MMIYRKEQQIKNEIKNTCGITAEKCQYYSTVKQLAVQWLVCYKLSTKSLIIFC